ncbi:Ribosome biogenesis protein BRX1 -like protein [Trichinella zimbabwensis]|uniref:Ribosome biogenesis protein BRX1 homolog n=1 Tax=Trichinella zimbabwensis TaxID=268475 RepID=A0A0V1HL59_9BILA|nr:Ribosome biogenesis protein BRX1 -like protein [Trichinella zimbabwensis]KRZ11507.1 Ribosome biogenesis protein BRX1 -like protein [Trichinella zimbabwensis]
MQTVDQDRNKELGEEKLSKTLKWTNRERVLIFCSRGTSFRDRHLMNDLKALMPHSKSESKMDKKDNLRLINEICEMKNCSKCLFFESRKKKDVYLWAVNTPRGPSAKFLVKNVHTMMELKLTGNCLKGSRPLLSFDKNFDRSYALKLVKELFIQIFSTPNRHPKSKPFVDHVLTFSVYDDRIWVRNYQIVDPNADAMEEIGPRMTLQLILIQEGSFGGPLLYKNESYVSPNIIRRQMRIVAAEKHLNRMEAKKFSKTQRDKAEPTFQVDPLEDVFNVDLTKIKDDEISNVDNKAKRQAINEVRRLEKQILKIKKRPKKKKIGQ